MHGDGRGMSVGEAEQEHYFSPTNSSPAAGSGANGSPAAGGDPHLPFLVGVGATELRRRAQSRCWLCAEGGRCFALMIYIYISINGPPTGGG